MSSNRSPLRGPMTARLRKARWAARAVLGLAVLGPIEVHAADDLKDAPLWEVGAGVGVFSFPAYRGSSTVEDYVLPVPYFVYHGDFLKSDRHGTRGDFFESDRLEISISASASPPTRSNDIPAREGMPDLKPTAELGPEIDWTLWRSENHGRILKFRLPAREAFTVERRPRGIGVVVSLNLALAVTDISALPGWNFGFLSGPIWGSRAQNAYFYSVAPIYASATRPAYSAPAGYAGTQFLMSASKRYSQFWVGAFVRYDTLANAAFADSPLVARRSFAAAGFAISWIFAESESRVELNE
jgi:MipA family protein